MPLPADLTRKDTALALCVSAALYYAHTHQRCESLLFAIQFVLVFLVLKHLFVDGGHP